MSLPSKKKFDLKRIQKEYNISEKTIANMPIEEEELRKIYESYQIFNSDLEIIKNEVLSVLNRKLKGRVHSIRCRIKAPDHLIEKIIRNINIRPDKYMGINEDNYYKIVTDLIGIRIIVLDKRDWREVHSSLLSIFRNLPKRYAVASRDIIEKYDAYDKEATSDEDMWLKKSYHAEQPVVYITSKDDRELYVDEYLKVDNSKTYYRSIHYIIRYAAAYFEIQVRTLFEEGWLEFDHRIKYPYDQQNKRKQEYADILSSLAVAADRLISFYDEEQFKNEEGRDGSQLLSVQEVCEDIPQTLEDKLKIMF